MSVPLPAGFSCETGCLAKPVCDQLLDRVQTGELFQEITFVFVQVFRCESC